MCIYDCTMEIKWYYISLVWLFLVPDHRWSDRQEISFVQKSLPHLSGFSFIWLMYIPCGRAFFQRTIGIQFNPIQYPPATIVVYVIGLHMYAVCFRLYNRPSDSFPVSDWCSAMAVFLVNIPLPSSGIWSVLFSLWHSMPCLCDLSSSPLSPPSLSHHCDPPSLPLASLWPSLSLSLSHVCRREGGEGGFHVVWKPPPLTLPLLMLAIQAPVSSSFSFGFNKDAFIECQSTFLGEISALIYNYKKMSLDIKIECHCTCNGK